MGGGRGDTARRHGRDNALKELERIYEGPIKGLQIAPEFYKLLGSAELKNTPLGRSLALQNQLLGEVSAGLGGSAFGARKGGRGGAGVLPPDLVSSIGENLASSLGASGTEGSPAGAIQAAMRFSGASEGIRAQRIGLAQQVLGQVGGASIMPSADQFLQVGANRATQAANYQYNYGMAQGAAKDQAQSELFQGIGKIGAVAAAPLTGGASLALLGVNPNGYGGGGGGGMSGLLGMGGGGNNGYGGSRTPFGPFAGMGYGSSGGGGGWSGNFQPQNYPRDYVGPLPFGSAYFE